jgi:hypothetical protein
MTSIEKREMIEKIKDIKVKFNDAVPNVPPILLSSGAGLINELQKIEDSVVLNTNALDESDFLSIDNISQSTIIIDNFHKSPISIKNKIISMLDKWEDKTIILIDYKDDEFYTALESNILARFVVID